MEKNEISEHEVRIFNTLRSKSGQWLTSGDIIAACGNAASPRTVRKHLQRFVSLGITDHADVFPSRYRLSQKRDKRSAAYLLRLREAAEVFGIALGG